MCTNAALLSNGNPNRSYVRWRLIYIDLKMLIVSVFLPSIRASWCSGNTIVIVFIVTCYDTMDNYDVDPITYPIRRYQSVGALAISIGQLIKWCLLSPVSPLLTKQARLLDSLRVCVIAYKTMITVWVVQGNSSAFFSLVMLYVYVYICICTCICTCTCTCICICICIRIRIRTRICICICIYIYIHVCA